MLMFSNVISTASGALVVGGVSDISVIYPSIHPEIALCVQCIDHTKLSSDGWMDISLTPSTTRAPLAVLITFENINMT